MSVRNMTRSTMNTKDVRIIKYRAMTMHRRVNHWCTRKPWQDRCASYLRGGASTVKYQLKMVTDVIIALSQKGNDMLAMRVVSMTEYRFLGSKEAIIDRHLIYEHI